MAKRIWLDEVTNITEDQISRLNRRNFPSSAFFKSQYLNEPKLVAEPFKDVLQLPEMHFNFQNEICGKLSSDFDSIILEGLKRKGFTFNNRETTEDFIKGRCKKVEHTNSNEHFFLVDGTPFLKVDYAPDFKMEGNVASASLGKFTYL